MFDFPFHEASVWTGLYCLLFYLIIVISNYRSGLKFPYQIPISSSKRRWTIFFIGFFIVTHCSQGDFYHYQQGVYDYWKAKGDTWSFVSEEIYNDIILFVRGNYFLFRILVWGGAFTLFCLIAKRMKVPVFYATVLLIATHSLIFAYARATLAMAVYFFGLSFLCRPLKIKTISYVIGILLIMFSMEFHTSSIIMIIMTLMLFIPVKKWSLLLILIILPLFIGIFKDYFFLIALSDSNEVMSEKMQMYAERETIGGIAYPIIQALEYASFYLPTILTTIVLFTKNRYKKCSKEIFRFYKVTIGIVLSTIVFALMGDAFFTFVYRTLFMSMIPLTIIITYLYRNKLMNKKYFTICVFSGFLFLFAKYMYDIYCVILG